MIPFGDIGLALERNVRRGRKRKMASLLLRVLPLVIVVLWLAGRLPTYAQANGDPSATQNGKMAADRESASGPKSGANAMPKGASGAKGASETTSGSNGMSGTGTDRRDTAK